eukprot:6034760-Prymnesium_polylepis.1
MDGKRETTAGRDTLLVGPSVGAPRGRVRAAGRLVDDTRGAAAVRQHSAQRVHPRRWREQLDDHLLRGGAAQLQLERRAAAAHSAKAAGRDGDPLGGLSQHGPAAVEQRRQREQAPTVRPVGVARPRRRVELEGRRAVHAHRARTRRRKGGRAGVTARAVATKCVGGGWRRHGGGGWCGRPVEIREGGGGSAARRVDGERVLPEVPRDVGVCAKQARHVAAGVAAGGGVRLGGRPEAEVEGRQGLRAHTKASSVSRQSGATPVRGVGAARRARHGFFVGRARMQQAAVGAACGERERRVRQPVAVADADRAR